MRHLKHCLNPKVIAAVAAVAAGVYVFAPGAFAAALPLLILAICPLSMVAMIVLMRGRDDDSSQPPAPSEDVQTLQAQVAGLEEQLATGTTRPDAPGPSTS